LLKNNKSLLHECSKLLCIIEKSKKSGIVFGNFTFEMGNRITETAIFCKGDFLQLKYSKKIRGTYEEKVISLEKYGEICKLIELLQLVMVRHAKQK